MSRIALGILGAILAIVGIWSLIPAWSVEGMSSPAWFSWLQIVVGVIALIIAISDSGE